MAINLLTQQLITDLVEDSVTCALIRSLPRDGSSGTIKPGPVPEGKLPEDENGGFSAGPAEAKVTVETGASSESGVDAEVLAKVDYSAVPEQDSKTNQPSAAEGKIAYWTKVEFERPTEEVTKLEAKRDYVDGWVQQDFLDDIAGGKKGLRFWINGIRKKNPTVVVVKWKKDDGTVVSTVKYTISMSGFKATATELTAQKLEVVEGTLKVTFATPVPWEATAKSVVKSGDQAMSGVKTITGDGVSTEYTLLPGAGGKEFTLESITGTYVSVTGLPLSTPGKALEGKLPEAENGGAASAESGVTVSSEVSASEQEGIDAEVKTTLDFASAPPKEYPQELPPSSGGAEAFWFQVEWEAPEGSTKNRAKVNEGEYEAVQKNDTLNSKPGKTGVRWWLNAVKYKEHPETHDKMVVEWQKEDGSVVSTVEYTVTVESIQIQKKEAGTPTLTLDGTNLKLTFEKALPARISATVVCSSEKKEGGEAGEDVTKEITEEETKDGKTKEFILTSSADAAYKYKLKSVTSDYITVGTVDGAETIKTPLRKVATKRSKK